MSLVNQAVLVTGATGFLGGALVRRLASEGVSVKALARRPNRDAYIRDCKDVEIIMGDITDSKRMQEVMANCQYVFHVAAATGGTLQHQQKVNVEGTWNVVQAAAISDIRRFIHVSTIAVYGYDVNRDISEKDTTEFSPRRVAYNITKREAEDVFQNIAHHQRLSYTIIRPGMIYGSRSGMWTRNMFRIARRNPTTFVGNGGGKAPIIHVDDVVDMMITVATHPNAHQQSFNCVHPHSPTWREYLGAYSKLAGHGNWRSIPVPIMKLLSYSLEGIQTLRGEPANLPRLVDFSQRTIQFKMDKAQQLLDWQPQIDLDEGIQSCIPYLREKGLLH